ncbi:MAG: hypothetical protein JNK72_23530 [Myxococcales bacterium]|nr:hypothetical protein [Myxococcales bacterium]
MEILLDKRAVKQIRLSAIDAMEEGDTETLRDDILDTFSEDQVEEIERRIDTDFYDFLGETLEEWAGEDVDELFDLLESQLADVGVELKFESAEGASEDEDSDADFDDDDDDLGDDDEPIEEDDDD